MNVDKSELFDGVSAVGRMNGRSVKKASPDTGSYCNYFF